MDNRQFPLLVLFLLIGSSLFAQRNGNRANPTYPNTPEGFLEECKAKYAMNINCDCAVMQYRSITQPFKEETLERVKQGRQWEISTVEEFCSKGLMVVLVQPGDAKNFREGMRFRRMRTPYRTVVPEYAPEDAIEACEFLEQLKNEPLPALDDMKAPGNDWIIFQLSKKSLCIN